MGVSLLENKAELQLVEIAIFDRPISEWQGILMCN